MKNEDIMAIPRMQLNAMMGELEKLIQSQRKMAELLSPATIDKIARCMTSISKKSTTQNEKKEEQEVSTSEVSRNLYNEFSAVSDQHTADHMENKNHTNIEEEDAHDTSE